MRLWIGTAGAYKVGAGVVDACVRVGAAVGVDEPAGPLYARWSVAPLGRLRRLVDGGLDASRWRASLLVDVDVNRFALLRCQRLQDDLRRRQSLLQR